MARASLIFPYQWRAFWRRVLRTGRVKFYLSVLALVGWVTAGALPERLARASLDLAAGQTASMDRLLLVLCLLWLVVLGENLHVSLSNERLRRFPTPVRSLLALKLSSLFLSPSVWLATIVSLLGLLPLLSAREPLLGILTALFLLALTIGVGLSVSQLLDVARRRRLRFAVTAFATAVLLLALVSQGGASALSSSLAAMNPATLVTTVAVATTARAMIVPVTALLVSGALVWSLLLWSFVRSLYDERTETTARRATSIARLPGRFGPLLHK